MDDGEHPFIEPHIEDEEEGHDSRVPTGTLTVMIPGAVDNSQGLLYVIIKAWNDKFISRAIKGLVIHREENRHFFSRQSCGKRT